MRFCDFFIEYKLGLKEIKNLIPFTKLPLYRKIAIVLLFVIGVIGLIFSVTHKIIWAFITYGIAILLFIIFFIIDSKKKNLRNMLDNHYKLYSQKRMNMIISVLNIYDIKSADTDTIDLLITEATNAQIQCDYLLPLKKPLKALGAIIIPIVIYAAQKIADAVTIEEVFNMSLQIIFIIICIFSIIIAITPIIKDLFYRDYNKYNELLYDLNQVKIFYSKD
ncbi:hypothetical protein RZO55_07395 [Clostridium boliviensis]|uniref:Uncharacterized protein n=1 Tax=Clostridium boliviensis TaxID=318465 RepID=A0ABU4GIF8_9CLOT|nr:hypothetical protein [Clostridium boliviensis]MDW2797399.1 hypothetical protein [Clostridium boliviensis]